MRKIRIFDTTLRDGEQSPGASMNVDEKIQLARQLAALKVDIIEAGFAISSPGDFEAIKRIGDEIEGPVLCSLARAKEEDIKRAWEALKDAPKKRIHTFHSTSDIHLKYQFRVSREEALKRSVAMVELARSYVEDVEFSPMDATRTDLQYLLDVVEAVVEAGASTVNIPDTVGYTTPAEFGEIIGAIKKRIREKAVISVHCHNDLGLAVANSLAAISNGAGQVECTVNGIGERAGNCSMEEVVMALRTRKDFFNAGTGINTKEIVRTSRLVSKITGIPVQPNKAIVGANAFAHESGIHQDGLLKEKTTYEIMTPEDIGLQSTKLVMGKHSGRHAFKTRLKELGFMLNQEEVDSLFEKFKRLADQKKEIYDEDLEALVSEATARAPELYSLVDLSITSGLAQKPTAMVKMKIGEEIFDRMEHGDGPVDATYKAIVAITKTKSTLRKFEVKSITGGTDALGEVSVSLEEDGRVVRGNGADTDIIVAAAKAYIEALNRLALKKAT
ncbi:2-isopropylmalate synthase [Candidatus Sulfobium mesophilum]|uniref:2-isopropylmalate synthase n=1 Tax=Candidatus Sulfobium mesophilum TaxID=2016548 RepID=A0A2U3QE45_9BACT|nr:2-isopropylmalate synthase [Candidatus Sulfobium mesophilum]